MADTHDRHYGSFPQFYANGGVLLNASVANTLNQWHDVVVRRSGGSLSLFFDNSLAASGNLRQFFIESYDTWS